MVYGLRYPCKICKGKIHCFQFNNDEAKRERAILHAVETGAVSSRDEIEIFDYPTNRRKTNACLPD